MDTLSCCYKITLFIFIEILCIAAARNLNKDVHQPGFITIPTISKRVKRSADNEIPTLKLTLQMPHGETSIHLYKSDTILLPGAMNEVQHTNYSESTPLKQDCHYQGKIEGYDLSYAALSVCNGVVGVFDVNGTQYSIQPLKITGGDKFDIERQPHAVKPLKKTGFENYISSSFSLHQSRHKRAVHSDKYLEVIIVTDSSVVDFHGEEETELFLLALFNLVNLIYSHSSLGVNIKLSLVRLLLLSDETADEMWEGGDPRISLDKFCAWASVNSVRSEDSIGHYDFSMYLSRGRMAPAGYAPVTGMCRPSRSCALIKEDGFSTAFVTAHEIGHVLGMSHDGEGTNKCVNEPKRGSIMAPLVMANLNNYFWSPCSAREIDVIISSLYCLNDNPHELEWKDLKEPLGDNWDLNEQCRKDFGQGFKLCSRVTHNFNPCEHLWCSTPDNRYLCKTKRAPPLPGSECAQGMWCYESQCIIAKPEENIWKEAHYRSIEGRVDGQWSTWSSWSKCSTSCGRGLKSRSRTCDNPTPTFGGRDCDGDSYDLRICNLPHCQRVVDDTRADQCSDYDKTGRTYKPFQPDNSDDYCLLNCKTVEQNVQLYGEIEALDGTFCSYDNTNSMCYSGSCIPVGCDGKLYSAAEEDQCGTCMGNNSNCTLRQQFFNERLERGEYQLVRLYPGTRSFRLRKPSDVFGIVLQNLRTNATLLHGDGAEISGSLVDDGVLWKYNEGRTQLLETTGPLLSAYDIKILSPYSGMRATLNIRFTEPLQIIRSVDQINQELETNEIDSEPENSEVIHPLDVVSTTPTPRYKWTSVGWTECSRTCGTGDEMEIIECTSILTNHPVSSTFCSLIQRPDVNIRPCTLQLCSQNEHRWLLTQWSECKPTCADTPQTRQRYALCVVHPITNIQEIERVDNSYCEQYVLPELEQYCPKSADCNRTVQGYWLSLGWSECSVSCGVGQQSREVTCKPIQDTIKQAECFEAHKPPTELTCVQPACLTTTIKPSTTTRTTLETTAATTPQTTTATTRTAASEQPQSTSIVEKYVTVPITASRKVYNEPEITTTKATVGLTLKPETTVTKAHSNSITETLKPTIATTDASPPTKMTTPPSPFSKPSKPVKQTASTVSIDEKSQTFKPLATASETITTVLLNELKPTAISNEQVTTRPISLLSPKSATFATTHPTAITQATKPNVGVTSPSVQDLIKIYQNSATMTRYTVSTALPAITLSGATLSITDDIFDQTTVASRVGYETATGLFPTKPIATKETTLTVVETEPVTKFVRWWTSTTTPLKPISTISQPTERSTRSSAPPTGRTDTPQESTMLSKNFSSVRSLVTSSRPQEETTPSLHAEDMTTKFVWWWTQPTRSLSTTRPSVINQNKDLKAPEIPKTTPRFSMVWWWTSTKGPSSLDHNQDTTTPITISKTAEEGSITNGNSYLTKMLTSQDRVTVGTEPSTAPAACNEDHSSLCTLMNARKCGLLLFKKICCKTCVNFS